MGDALSVAAVDYPDFLKAWVFVTGNEAIVAGEDFPDWTDGASIFTTPITPGQDFPDWTKAIAELFTVITTPTSIPDCVVWYDITQVTTLTDGQSFGIWPNEVTPGGTWDVQNAGTPPVYYNTTAAKLINGRPAAWFGGAGGLSNNPNVKSIQGAGGAWTMFGVGYNTGAGVQAIFDQNAQIQFIQTNGTSLQSVDNGHTATQPGCFTDRVNLLTVVADTTSLRPRVNGTAGNAVATGTLSTAGGILGMGSASVDSADFWDGPIVEVIGYSRALTDVEVASVENYLHVKWDTPLS